MPCRLGRQRIYVGFGMLCRGLEQMCGSQARLGWSGIASGRMLPGQSRCRFDPMATAVWYQRQRTLFNGMVAGVEAGNDKSSVTVGPATPRYAAWPCFDSGSGFASSPLHLPLPLHTTTVSTQAPYVEGKNQEFKHRHGCLWEALACMCEKLEEIHSREVEKQHVLTLMREDHTQTTPDSPHAS